MSTRFEGPGDPLAAAEQDQSGPTTLLAEPSTSHRYRLADPVEQLALVACAKREVLLRAHRHRLRGEELEDCYSQATLELLASVRAGRRFAGRAHLARTLELRFQSRVHDRRRALGGRSPLSAALEQALPLGVGLEREVELADPRAEVHPQVARRIDLQRLVALAGDLTADQRLALFSQAFGVEQAELCERYGWSAEKYRKVLQRARARLRELLRAAVSEPADAPGGPIGSPSGIDAVPDAAPGSE